MKKKTYTKYDYYCIQTKIGNIAGLFALAAVSAALLMGAVAAGVHDYRQGGGLGLSSWLCLAVFALSLPMIVRNVKGYRNLQKSSGSNRRKKWKRTRILRWLSKQPSRSGEAS